MIPVLSQFLSDNESLFDYERFGHLREMVTLSRVCQRLVAVERNYHPERSDMYYDGLYRMYLSTYHSFSELMWRLPYDLSKEFLVFHQQHLYVRADRFDDWMELTTQIPPLLIVASAFIDDFSFAVFNQFSALCDFATTRLKQFQYTALLHPYIPDLEYFVSQSKGLHDLHLHLNGSTETDVLWGHLLTHIDRTVKDFYESFKSRQVRQLSEQIISDFTPDTLSRRLTDAEKLRNKMALDVANENQDVLPSKIHQFDFHRFFSLATNGCCSGVLIEELLFYIMILSLIRNQQNDFLAGCFHHYLLIKGLVHRFVVMQRMQKSFPQFQLLTENSFRYDIERYYTMRFLQLSSGSAFQYLSNIEGRFSPKATLAENMSIVSRILSGFEEARKMNPALRDTQISLIAHFIKMQDKNLGQPIRHRFLRKHLAQKALALDSFIQKHPNGKYIVGIDAAANEMDAGPEVFAPIFHFLRPRCVNHVTFHVGEDFRHLLSGLRSIWEAIFFLDLQPGDRLGHCTALGIKPQLWLERTGNQCFISQGEWLDDLIFAWEMVKELALPELNYLRLRLESAIHELSRKVYNSIEQPYLLSKAWKYRKYDPFLYLEDSSYSKSLFDASFSLPPDLSSQLNGDLTLLKRYHQDMHSREQYDEFIQIQSVDLITVEELEILQNHLLSILSKKRIAIEALPSSNLRISYYNDIREYHLHRWLQQDTIKNLLPAVVIGTDDPGIFMTNIYIEYARVYLHLEECGFSTMKRFEILSNLHQCSSIYNFNRYE